MTSDSAGIAWFVLDVSLRALAAAAAVGVVLRLLRVRAAAAVHRAWSAVMVTMLFMPVLPSIVPALPLRVPAGAGGLLRTAASIEESSPGGAGVSSRPGNVIDTGPSSNAAISERSTRLQASMTAPRPWLLFVCLATYAAGVLLLGARLFCGWILAAAMISRARRGGALPVDAARPVYESSEVAVPMTVGAIRPVIVLPGTWKTWDPDTLAAIIAHETAHVRRHDAPINLAACLNRAIFWFHPLAWWLERKLAMTAEHACDAAAARAIASPGRYAGILVEMADAVRRNRGRVAWQAIGVDGPGGLDRRIDRLLRGEAFAGTSRTKRVAASIGCVLAIAIAVSCRQQISATPLRADPELAKRLAERDQRTKEFEAARDMTQDRADALEQAVAANAEDFDARRQLVTYYRASSKVAWDKKVPGLRRHALWLIEHHPEHEVEAPALSPQFDPEGFTAAKRLWEAHLGKPDASAFLVYRAANFFAPHDKAYAEQLIMRGMAMDPQSAALKARMAPDQAGYEWPVQLSSLYAAAIRGSESVWGTSNDLRTRLDRINSPYAVEVRRKLETTTDAKLLGRVGSRLIVPDGSTNDPAIKQALDETRTLGARYLERALQLDPNLASAKAALVRTRMPVQGTDAERLANRAFEHYMTAEDITEYARKDLDGGKRQRDEAKADAEEVLKMAAAHAQDPAYSAAVMTAHHVLATAALRNGDRDGAVHHLRESVKVPASEQIQYAPPFSWSRVVNRLLKEGERERVVEFLEAFAGLTISDRDRLLKDAQAIREGRMPLSYQYMVAREGR